MTQDQSKKQLRAAIYARISTVGQKDGFGLQSQITKCERYIKMNRWKQVKVYQDTISGVKEERPSMNKMFEDMKNNVFDVIVIRKLDRLGRNATLIMNMVEKIKSHGIELCTCEGMKIDTMTPMGNLKVHILAGIAQYERSTISERMTAGRNRRAQIDGEKGGALFFGYKRYKEEGKRSTVVVDEQNAFIVRIIFDLIKGGYTEQEVADILLEQNVRGMKWSRSCISRILKKEHIYSGCKRGESDFTWPVIL